MNIYKRVGSLILSLLLVFSLLSSTLAVQTYAATSPTLSLESKSVNAGEQFTVAVDLANATSVCGGNFTLQYDSNLLTVDSYTFGSIVGSHTKNCNLDYQSAGNLIRFTFSGVSALTSSGTLVTFTFTAKQSVSGSAALQFNAYKMYDENGSSITSTATGSTITIKTEPVVSPTLSITSKTVTVGETFSVPIVISDSAAVYGGNFTLQYDSDLLTADSYTFGSIVSSHTKNCNLDYQSAGNLIRVTFSGSEAVSSDGTLVTITFTAQATGTANLSLNTYKMYDKNGSSIFTLASGSNVVISSESHNIITGSCGDNVTGELNLDTGILTISGTGAIWNYGDNNGVFSTYKNSIRKICINDGVTRIGDCDFDNYDMLEEVIIAESVVEIGARAFRDCDSLKTIVLPDSVTKIDFECFSGCDTLTTVHLPNGLLILNNNLFCGCPLLETLIIPNSVIEIKYGVFSSTGIKSIDVPSSVQSIGGDAFMGCDNLERITLNEGLLSIEKRAFVDCPKLLEICIPKSVVTIADDEWGHAIDLNTTIYGYRNSVAQIYANKFGNEFIPLDSTELVAISVSTLPNRTIYYIGDKLNTTGLELLITYSDGSTETITSGFTISGFSSTSAGAKTITVSYEGFMDTFTVTVKTPSIVLSSNNKSMTVGDSSAITATTTPSGQTITWTSSNTSVATVSEGKITAKTSGSAIITAKFIYNGTTYSKTCNVTVVSTSAPEPTLSSISIATKPTKTTYEIGESLNTSGLTLKLTYSDGSTKIVSNGFATSGFSSTTAGTKNITVTYEGKETSFVVTVNAKSSDLQVTIESKKACAGKTVLVNVSLQNNPGIWGMDLIVNYDKTKLTLISVTNGTVFTDAEWTKGNLSGEKYILSYEAGGLENITKNGVIATLEFAVNENAQTDDFYEVSVSYKSGDIINVGFEEINPTIVSGGIRVINVIYGDLNDDGVVNKKDSLLMKMYLADNTTEIDKEAADVFHDGVINKKDSLYLKQFLAGLDVELGA